MLLEPLFFFAKTMEWKLDDLTRRVDLNGQRVVVSSFEKTDKGLLRVQLNDSTRIMVHPKNVRSLTQPDMTVEVLHGALRNLRLSADADLRGAASAFHAGQFEAAMRHASAWTKDVPR